MLLIFWITGFVCLLVPLFCPVCPELLQLHQKTHPHWWGCSDPPASKRETAGLNSFKLKIHVASWMIFTNTLPHNRAHQSVTFSSARWALIYNPPLFAASSPFPSCTKIQHQWTVARADKNSGYQSRRHCWEWAAYGSKHYKPYPASSASCPPSSPWDRYSETRWPKSQL